MYIVEQGDKLLETNGTIEDLFPPLLYIRKSKTWKEFEAFKNDLFRFLGKKYEDAKRTYDKGNNMKSA